MGRSFGLDESGAVTTDWVALVVGIVLLGTVVAASTMGDSAGYLMDEFADLNREYAALSDDGSDPAREEFSTR